MLGKFSREQGCRPAKFMELAGANKIPETFLSEGKQIAQSGNTELTLTASLQVLKLYQADRCKKLRAFRILETAAISSLRNVLKEIQKTVQHLSHSNLGPHEFAKVTILL